MSSSSAHDQFVSLLRLRASPPAVPPGVVRRPRLEDRLTDAVAHPVTLVSAGPGYGKTLTLASWIRLGSAPGATAWLTMDEADNDLQAFWSDVLGALTIGDALPSDSPCGRSCRPPASAPKRPTGSAQVLPSYRHL